MKTIDGSLSWGTNGKGLYLATNYNYAKATLQDGVLSETALGVTLDTTLESIKTKAWETVVTYGFENGIRLGASYHYINTKLTALDGDEDSTQKYVQLIADYNVTPNFKIWAETCIDAGSDDYAQRITNTNFVDENGISTDKDGHNSVMFGARYVF